MEPRTPVTARVVDGRLVVLCDDGSVWRYDDAANRWQELAPIPGSIADAEDRN